MRLYAALFILFVAAGYGQTYSGKFDHHQIVATTSSNTTGSVPTTAAGSISWMYSIYFNGQIKLTLPDFPPDATRSAGTSWKLASNMPVSVTLQGTWKAMPTRDFVTRVSLTIEGSIQSGLGSTACVAPAPTVISGIAANASVPVDFTMSCSLQDLFFDVDNRGLIQFALRMTQRDGQNDVLASVGVTSFYAYAPAGQSPDQISFIDDSFSPPLNQPFLAGLPTGNVTVKVAYSLNSQTTAEVEVYWSGYPDRGVRVPVQRGNGVVSVTLNSLNANTSAVVPQRVYGVFRIATSSPLISDFRDYHVTDSKDVIQILSPTPPAGSPAPTSPQAVSATCFLQLKSESTRDFALRIFDPDSPITALLGSSAFLRGADQQSSQLTIPGFSVKPGDVTLGRIALKCVLYDVSHTQVVAESGYFVYALPNSVTGNPSITPGGVKDAARGGPVVSRGGLASIYGTNLAGFTTKNNYVPVSTYLGGVRVSVGVRYAPLIFVSPTQINFQVPFETPVSSGVPVTVTRDGIASAPVNAAVADYAPQVFVYGAAQDPIAVHVNGALVTAANPVTAGEVIVVFGTGVGAVSKQPATGGTTGPFEDAPTATLTPTVTVGGARGQVLFAGLTPGFVGLAQFNIKLPTADALPPQSLLPLVISFGSAASTTVNLAY